jgi:heme/copper-type cytochrome/quinol oxidase subunit 1
VFAAFYYWLPKITGRMMNERVGKISFWLMFIGFNVAFFPMHILGLLGMPRRIFTYPAGIGWDATNFIVTIGAFVFAIGIGVSLWNFLVSSRTGAVAGSNPWHADTLEWGMPSPPPVYATEHIPTVLTRHPMWDEHDEERDPYGTRVLSNGRETMGTTTLDAVPDGILRMPGDSIWPFVLSLTMVLAFYGLVFKVVWLAFPGVLLTLACIGVWLWPKPEEQVAV